MPKVDIIKKRNFPGLPGVYPWRGARLDPVQIDLQRAVPLLVRTRRADGSVMPSRHYLDYGHHRG